MIYGKQHFIGIKKGLIDKGFIGSETKNNRHK